MNPHGDVRSGFVFLEPRVFLCEVDNIVLFVKYHVYLYSLVKFIKKSILLCL